MEVLLYTAVFASVLFHSLAQLDPLWLTPGYAQLDPLWRTPGYTPNDDSRGVAAHSGLDNSPRNGKEEEKGRNTLNPEAHLDQTERGRSESSLENGYISGDENSIEKSYIEETSDGSDKSSQENGHSLAYTSNEFVGSCTKSDYKKWYRDEFPNECKDIYGNSNQNDLTYSLYCDSDCGEAYSDFLRSCGEEGELYAAYYDSLCWTNERGVPCFLFLGSFRDSNPKEAVKEKCLPHNGSCSSNCHRALEYFRFKLGCCINNIYNTSVPGDVVQYTLWSSCGVNTPDFCENVHSENIGLTLTVVKPLILGIIFVIATLMF